MVEELDQCVRVSHKHKIEEQLSELNKIEERLSLSELKMQKSEEQLSELKKHKTEEQLSELKNPSVLPVVESAGSINANQPQSNQKKSNKGFNTFKRRDTFSIGAHLYSWMANRDIVGVKEPVEVNTKKKKMTKPDKTSFMMSLHAPSYVECLFALLENRL